MVSNLKLIFLLTLFNLTLGTTVRYMVDNPHIQNCLAMRDMMEQTPLFDSVKFDIWQFFKKDPKQSFKSFRNIIVDALYKGQLNTIGVDFSDFKKEEEILKDVDFVNKQLKKILTGINIQTFVSKKSKKDKILETIKVDSMKILDKKFEKFKEKFKKTKMIFSDPVDINFMDDSAGKLVDEMDEINDDLDAPLKDSGDIIEPQPDLESRSRVQPDKDDKEIDNIQEFIENYRHLKKVYYEKYFSGKGDVKGFFHFTIDRRKNKIKNKIVKLKMEWYKDKKEAHERTYTRCQKTILNFDKKYNTIQEVGDDFDKKEELAFISNTKIANLPLKYLVNYFLWLKDKLGLLDLFKLTSGHSDTLLLFLARTFKKKTNAVTTYTNIVELYYRELFYEKLKDNIQKMADIFFDEETADFLPMTDIFHDENKMGGNKDDHQKSDKKLNEEEFDPHKYYKSTKEGGIYNLKSINDDIKKLNSLISTTREAKYNLVEKLKKLVDNKMKKVLKLIQSVPEYKEYLQAMKHIFVSARKARDASAKYLQFYNTHINLSALQKNMEIDEEEHFTLSKNSMQEIQKEISTLMEMQENIDPDLLQNIYTTKGNKKEFNMAKTIMTKYYLFLDKYKFYIQKSVLVLQQKQSYVQEIEKMDKQLDIYLGKMFQGIQNKIGDLQCFTRTQSSYYIFSMMKMNIIINEEIFLKEFLSVNSRQKAMEFMSYNYSIFTSDNYLHYILVNMNQIKLALPRYSKKRFLEMKTKYIKEFSLILNMYKDFTEFSIMNSDPKIKVPSKLRRVQKLFLSIYERCKRRNLLRQRRNSELVQMITEEIINMIPFLGNIPFASKAVAYIVAKLINMLGKLLFTLGKFSLRYLGRIIQKLKVSLLSVNKEDIISVNYRDYIHFKQGNDDFGYKKSQLRNLVGIDNDRIKDNLNDTYATFGNEYSKHEFFSSKIKNEIKQEYFDSDPKEIQPNMNIHLDMIEKKYRTNVIDANNSVNMIDSAILFDEKMITLTMSDYEEYPIEINNDIGEILNGKKQKSIGEKLQENVKNLFKNIKTRLEKLVKKIKPDTKEKYKNMNFGDYLNMDDKDLKESMKNQIINLKLQIAQMIKIDEKFKLKKLKDPTDHDEIQLNRNKRIKLSYRKRVEKKPKIEDDLEIKPKIEDDLEDVSDRDEEIQTQSVLTTVQSGDIDEPPSKVQIGTTVESQIPTQHSDDEIDKNKHEFERKLSLVKQTKRSKIKERKLGKFGTSDQEEKLNLEIQLEEFLKKLRRAQTDPDTNSEMQSDSESDLDIPTNPDLGIDVVPNPDSDLEIKDDPNIEPESDFTNLSKFKVTPKGQDQIENEAIQAIEAQLIQKFFQYDPEYFMKLIIGESEGSNGVKRKFVVDGILNISTNINMDRRYNDFFETYFKFKIGENYLIENLYETRKIKDKLMIGENDLDLLYDIDFINEKSDLESEIFELKSKKKDIPIDKIINPELAEDLRATEPHSPLPNQTQITREESGDSEHFDDISGTPGSDLVPTLGDSKVRIKDSLPLGQKRFESSTRSEDDTVITQMKDKDDELALDSTLDSSRFNNEKIDVKDEETKKKLIELYNEIELLYDENLKSEYDKNDKNQKDKIFEKIRKYYVESEKLEMEDLFKHFEIDINPIKDDELNVLDKTNSISIIGDISQPEMKKSKSMKVYDEQDQDYGFTQDLNENLDSMRYLLSFEEFNIYHMKQDLFKNKFFSNLQDGNNLPLGLKKRKGLIFSEPLISQEDTMQETDRLSEQNESTALKNQILDLHSDSDFETQRDGTLEKKNEKKKVTFASDLDEDKNFAEDYYTEGNFKINYQRYFKQTKSEINLKSVEEERMKNMNIYLYDNDYKFMIKKDNKGQILIIPRFQIAEDSSDDVIARIVKNDMSPEDYLKKVLISDQPHDLKTIDQLGDVVISQAPNQDIERDSSRDDVDTRETVPQSTQEDGSTAQKNKVPEQLGDETPTFSQTRKLKKSNQTIDEQNKKIEKRKLIEKLLNLLV